MFKALRNYVVVKVASDNEEKSQGGIILAGAAAQNPFNTGTVVSVGPGGKILDGKLDAPEFEAGAVVVWGKGMGMEYRENGEKYCLLTIEEIAAKVV